MMTSPTSASCSVDDPNVYFNKRQEQELIFILEQHRARGEICTITVEGAGTPRCSRP